MKLSNNDKNELSLATRFANKVISCYADAANGMELTEKERKLITGYYIKTDEFLRNSKQGYSWKQVRLDEFSLVLAHLAKLGLDQSLGHFSLIPFRAGDSGTIRLTPVISASGYEVIVKRFALDPPSAFNVELVYSTDSFQMIKKDVNHEYDSFVFEVKQPFSRGDVVGAFAYIEYPDKRKNKLFTMSIEEIMKYKPQKADETFWRVGSENYKKMVEKTISKQALRKITLDPDKVNGMTDSFKFMEAESIEAASLEAQEVVKENNATGPMIDFVDTEFEDVSTVENSVETVETEETDEEISAKVDEFTLF